MTGAALRFRTRRGGLDRRMRKLFSRARARLGNMQPAFEEIGELMVASVTRNFEQGGRPEKWPESGRARTSGGKTLISTGRGLRSINARAGRNSLKTGTNVGYMAAHQFGVNKTVRVKAHTRKTARGIATVKASSRKMRLPERPWLMIQKEDREGIRDALMAHITGGGND